MKAGILLSCDTKVTGMAIALFDLACVSISQIEGWIELMKQDPFYIPDWCVTAVHLFRSTNDFPIQSCVISLGAKAYKKWEEFRCVLTNEESIQKWDGILSEWIQKWNSSSKRSMHDMLREEEEDVSTSNKIEHSQYMKLMYVLPKSWRLLPYPRQREATDVLMIRSDKSVLLVSMKTARKNFENSYSAELKAGLNWHHCHIVIAIYNELVFIIPAKTFYECGRSKFSFGKK